MAKIQGYLTLIGDYFDTAYISERLGINPGWERKHTEILGNGRPFGHCEWGIQTAMITGDDISPVAASLLLPVLNKLDLLRDIAIECNAGWEILFTVYVNGDFPVVVLPADFIGQAAQIGACIGFDVYLLN